jgi:hypothetical protein
VGDDVVDQIEFLCEMGTSSLISGKPYESLRFFAKAIQLSSKESELESALNSTNQLIASRGQQLGAEWARKLLLIGLVSKFGLTNEGKSSLEKICKLASVTFEPLTKPIVVVAGGCSSEVELQMHAYEELVFEAFRGYWGTVISGGTDSGISGLIGEVQKRNPSAIRAVGYVPKSKSNLADKRYHEIRLTEGEDFSPNEPLQYWIDIITSGISPSGVRFLGVNGGRISAIEYRMALALGAKVGIIRGSGMEADTLLLDGDWNKAMNLVSLPNDEGVVKSFLQT